MQTRLTGVKPTGAPHLGNYAGAIRPTLEGCDEDTRLVIFVADVHALNSIGGQRLARYTFEVAATYLACGLDPERAVFFRQSDVPEIFELASILACVCPKGLINRAHAYKAAVAANLDAGRDPDADINMGLFSYPVLMAADILAFDAGVVPVGLDQRQHLEVAQELARRLNRRFGAGTVTMPAAAVRLSRDLPGIDGRKMSKTYGNDIALAAPREVLRARIARFVTDDRRVGEPGDPSAAPLYALAESFGSAAELDELAAAFAAGAGYADIKAAVFAIVDRRVAPIRERYAELAANPAAVHAALSAGAAQAREIASGVLARVKQRVGLGPS